MQSRKHKPTPWSAVFEHHPLCLRIIYPCCVLLWLMETFVAGSIPHCWSDQGAGATQRNNTHCRIRDDRNALSHNLHFYKGTFQLPQAAPCGAITLKKTFPDKQPYFLCYTTLNVKNITFSKCFPQNLWVKYAIDRPTFVACNYGVLTKYCQERNEVIENNEVIDVCGFFQSIQWFTLIENNEVIDVCSFQWFSAT